MGSQVSGGGAQDGPGARQDRGTCCLSRFHQRLIQAGPGQNLARAQGDRAHQTSHPQLQRPQGSATLAHHQPIKASGLKGCQGLGAEAGPTDFPARKNPLLYQHHPHAATGEAMGRQGAGQSSANHNHIPVRC